MRDCLTLLQLHKFASDKELSLMLLDFLVMHECVCVCFDKLFFFKHPDLVVLGSILLRRQKFCTDCVCAVTAHPKAR